MLTCSKCKKNCDLNDFENHYLQYHSSNGQILHYECPKCDRSYNFFSSFKQHWLNLHIDENASNFNETEPSNVKATTSKSEYSSISKDDVYSPKNSNTGKVVRNSANEHIKKKKDRLLQSFQNNVIEKYMKLQQLSGLSETYLQNFVTFAKEIVISGCQIIEDESKSVNESNTCVTSKCILDLFRLSFDGFETAQKRQSYLEKKGDYIPPIKYTIGIKSERVKRTGSKKQKKYVDKACGYFFPLRTIFKKVFELPNVYDTVFGYKKKLEDEKVVISNFVQSKVWKEKIKKFKTNDVLPLFLFSDDYETGNALGSHAGQNKLAGTYVSIPCFPPEYQSNLSSIFQAILYYSQDRVRFGNYSTFRKLIEELVFLEEEGIELNLPHENVRIFFKLGLILGDNLGLHALLGFVESFNANFMCRFCKMDKFQRSLAGIEDKDYMRSKKNYENDVRVGNVSLTGIKEKCVFHNLPDFHVTQNFSVDLMHDVLEGVCQFDMAALLNFYITEKKSFSLHDLNNRLSIHDWGTAQFVNIPPPILEKDLKNDNIKMSASETLTLIRHFGILVGDLVSEDDQCWQVYLCLRKILDIIMSPRIQPQSVVILENVIEEHHLLLRNVLKRNLKPKDHFLIHFPSIMRESGPLVNLWCMRMESKHQESLKFVSSCNCKKNICFTIAKKHQMKLAAILFENNFFTPLKIGPSKECLITDLNVSSCDPFSKDKQLLKTNIRVANWVEKNGSRYKPGMILCWLGLGIMAVGVWAWKEKDTFSNLSRLTNVALDPAFILILVGTVTSIIGFTGCVGALRENTCLLAAYAIFLASLLLLEMTLGVLGFVFKDWIKSQATGGFQAFIIHYRDDPDQQNLIDWIQEDWLQCCGIEGPKDWDRNNYFNCSSSEIGSSEACGVPFSCCKREPNVRSEIIKNKQCGYNVRKPGNPGERSIFERGCLRAGEEWLELNLVPVAGAIVSTMVLQNSDVTIYEKGCIQAGEEWLERNLLVIAAGAIGMAFSQILGICFAQNLRADIFAQKAKWH